MTDSHSSKSPTDFIPIATSGGVTLFAPASSFISFTNSPYYSHQHALADDIYPFSAGVSAFSPVYGDLVEAFAVRSPNSQYFRVEEDERLLIIRAAENPDVVVRILHTNCTLDILRRLTVGAAIGRIVRSGFYDFWTDPHIHVEVRKPTQFLRAKGSLPMIPLTCCSSLIGTLRETVPPLRIARVNENYTLVEPIEDVFMTLGPLQGFGCRVGKATGILDAGIPHYRMGSVHLEEGSVVNPGDHVTLWGMQIGTVTECHRELALFASQPMMVCSDDLVIRGLSVYTWVSRHPLLKLIPLRPHHPVWQEGDFVKLRLASYVR